jgi:hypothetical protein
MIDTITDFFSHDNRILFSSKSTDEGDFYLLDEIEFTPYGNDVAAHSRRRTRTDVRIDTVMTVTSCALDMLGSVMYLRSIPWKTLRIGDSFPFQVVVGRDIVNVSFRYDGQSVVAPDETIKYRTHHFYIDVYDPAFTQSKAAAEVWVGDDDNHIPVKVRAKLKIGAAEVHYRSSSNLQSPLHCRVEIPASR